MVESLFRLLTALQRHAVFSSASVISPVSGGPLFDLFSLMFLLSKLMKLYLQFHSSCEESEGHDR